MNIPSEKNEGTITNNQKFQTKIEKVEPSPTKKSKKD